MIFKYNVMDLTKMGLNEAQYTIMSTEKGVRDLLEGFLLALQNTKSGGQIKGHESRAMDRFLNKLDLSSGGEVDIESADVDLLKGLLMDDEISIHPIQTRMYHSLRRSLEKTLSC